MSIMKIIFLLCLIAITSCGDNYPKNGKLITEGLLAGSNSKAALVYRLDKSQFEQWKVLVKQAKENTIDDTDILSLRDQFTSSELVRLTFSGSEMLAQKSFNFELFIDTKIAESEQQKANLKKQLIEQEDIKNKMSQQQSISTTAKQKLRDISNDFKNKRSQLKALSKNKTEKASKSLATLTLQEKFIKSAQRGVNSRLENFVLDDTTLTCKERKVKSTNYKKRKKSFSLYLYADPQKINGTVYCAYYIPSGYNSSAQLKLTQALTSDHKKLLIAAARTKLTHIVLGKHYLNKARNVIKDNPTTNEAAHSFTYQMQRTQSQAQRSITKLNGKLEQLSNLDRDHIRKRYLTILFKQLGTAQDYFLLDELNKILIHESNVQPDGNFTLPSGEDFYLVSFQGSNKLRPSAMMYGVLRMEQFKNKELAKVSITQMFKFDKLPDITL